MSAEPTRWSAARDERSEAFGAVAAAYAAWRPGYPAEVVDFLAGGPGAPPRRVVDVGAGTGLLTEGLVAAGHDVVAVDTSADMLAELRARLPGVRTEVAGAERLPLPDASRDLVTAAQAAHWFDPEAAGAEFRRVLRPGGAVGFAWNTRVDDRPWLVELAGILAADARVQQGASDEGNRAVVDAFARALDAGVAATEHRWLQEVTPDAVVGRVASSSAVALLDDAARVAHLGAVRELLETHPGTRGRDVLEMPYLTSAWRLTPR